MQIFLHYCRECCKQHLCQIYSKAPLLDFTLNKLWYVIQQLSPQNIPRHRGFSSFPEYFLHVYIGNTRLCAIFLSRYQLASLDMLQSELVTVQRRIQQPCQLKEKHLLLYKKAYFRYGKVY